MIPVPDDAQRQLRASCSGCMSTGRCWVCDGRGRYEVGPGIWRGCGSCAGTGECPLCTPQPSPKDDVTITITLPRQTTSAGAGD